MEESQNTSDGKITRPIISADNPGRLILIVVVAALVLGTATGYILSNKGIKTPPVSVGAPKTPQQDTRTFRDFAEGVVKPKSQPSDPSEYTEGTHLLEREGAVSVALTSSVVDLSRFEGKKVKVFGETQKAIKEGWLMDVGRVEEIK